MFVMKTIYGRLKTSHEGLMIGNGILGSLIYGENKLLVSLDKVDLWDERNPDEYLNPEFDYDHLEKYLNEDYEKAFNIFDKCYNHPYPTKINAGLIELDFDVNDNDKSEIDYYNGQVNYYGKENQVNGYVDYSKSIIVLNFKKLPSFEIKTPKYLTESFEKKGLGYKKCSIVKDGDFTIVKQPMYNGRHFIIVIFTANNSLYITIKNSKNTDQAKIQLLKYVSNKNDNYKKHVNYFNNYFDKSGITTPNKDINEQYNLGRYYFASNSNKYPVSLHGVWTQNNDKLPPWKADYHNDINVQMSYEHYLKLGDFKEGKVLLDYLINLLPIFKMNANWFMKTDGYYIPGVMSQKGLPLGGWPQYAFNPCCQIWLIKAFDEYYEYTFDTKYLKDTIFPLFKGIEESIFPKLHLNIDGFYELGFHSSPEFFEDDSKSCFIDQTNFEVTMLRYLYSKLIKYSSLLNKPSNHYEDVYSKLHDYYRDENKLLMLSKTTKYLKSHRHFSHMLMYKNMKMVDPFINYKVIKSDIENLNSFGTDNWVGFSFVENAGLYAYSFDGEQAFNNLEIFTKAFVHPNGFHMNNDYKNLGYSKMDCYVMTLEANFGFINSLNDMMLNNYENKVCVFPAIPQSFKKQGVSINNLLLHGKHKVNASYIDNHMSFEIKLDHTDKLEIMNNFSNNPTLMIDGECISFKSCLGEMIKINAKKEIRYL